MIAQPISTKPRRGPKIIPHKNNNGIELKYCRNCEIWTPVSEFTPTSHTWDSLTTQCNKCVAEKQRERYHSNPDKYRTKNNVAGRSYYSRNREKIRARQNQRHSNKATSYCASDKSFHPIGLFTRNPRVCDTCLKEKQKQAENKELSKRNKLEKKLIEKLQKEQTKPARITSTKKPKPKAPRPGKMRQYYESNPGKRREHKSIRRGLKLENGGKYERQDWEYLKEISGHKCLKCGAAGVKLAPDHIVPWGIGSNTLTNLQPYCWGCNSRKGRRWIEDNRSEEVKELIFRRAFPNLIGIMETETRISVFLVV